MMSAWGDMWGYDQELKMAKDPTVIAFQTQNPYMAEQETQEPVDLVAKAKELIE